MTDVVGGVKEALAVARGDAPAARIHMNGFTYVPLEEYERLRAALKKMQRSRDRYRQAWEAEKARAALEDKHD